MVRTKMIVGNWKMYGSTSQTESLLQGLIANISELKPKALIGVMPPFVYLSQTVRLLANTPLFCGAQNVAATIEGAYTGEISAEMIKDVGCEYVLVGHSERRQLFGEDENTCVKKWERAHTAGLKVIFCVGETLAEREAKQTETIIFKQLKGVMEHPKGLDFLKNTVIAYEPVWAIGTGLAASPEQAEAVHSAIRTHISGGFPSLEKDISLLYGGSVKMDNARSLLAMPNIDGALVGGASLKVDQFIGIIECIN